MTESIYNACQSSSIQHNFVIFQDFWPTWCTRFGVYDFIFGQNEYDFWNQRQKNMLYTAHEIAAGHRSLSGTISCVTDRIRFLPVTMTGRFSNFNSTSYTKDRHELQVTETKCPLPDTMSGTGEISI